MKATIQKVCYYISRGYGKRFNSAFPSIYSPDITLFIKHFLCHLCFKDIGFTCIVSNKWYKSMTYKDKIVSAIN